MVELRHSAQIYYSRDDRTYFQPNRITFHALASANGITSPIDLQHHKPARQPSRERLHAYSSTRERAVTQLKHIRDKRCVERRFIVIAIADQVQEVEGGASLR